VPALALVMTLLHDLNSRALNPAASAVVSACAGSGKTWLLVSRIVRALLEGAQPSEILAITFTRKAAQEMSARLREWLRALATADDATVERMLEEREVPRAHIGAMLPLARQLYERCLTAEPGITITTFHSWFLQLLRRAPLDAGALGEVKLAEETAALVSEAWRRFARRMQREPESAAAGGLDRLFRDYGLFSTRQLLMNFVQHRADWWAYGHGHTDPVQRALDQMSAALEYAADEDIAGVLWRDASFVESLDAYENYLEQGVTRGRPSAEKLALAGSEADPNRRFELAWTAIFSDKGEPRKYGANKKQEAALGAEGQQRFFELHRELSARLADMRAHLQAQHSYWVNNAALHCGAALLEEYQGLKRERQVIDYGDIEWRAWRLVSDSEHAVAMQCKLDARYRHVLLDEFQDTNPLQWLTLQSWFAAAAESDAHPCVFVVGDPKQSIYRFRRAEARLFARAATYLAEGFGAAQLSQDESRRCAPPVIDVVNRLFTAAGMDDFRAHGAHYKQKPGRVEVWPLIAKDAAEEAANDGALRDPFVTPLIEREDNRRQREAALLAERIAVIKKEWWVADDEHGEVGRPARYSDIMLLARRRTHLEVYESALRHAGIPFTTSRHGGLLDTLEAQDLLALLEFLISPFDDLKLAHALRSPVFSCSDGDLIAIATARLADKNKTWWQCLQALQADVTSAALTRAHGLLESWLARADTLPVHDQLDRIYFEADVPRRYADAVPTAMRGAVTANLDALMQRALDTDSGRYPSLPRFITDLKELREAPDQEAPDEGTVVDGSGDAVRILTVHGAKGLEAPIVWLLDAAAAVPRDRGYSVLLDWPEDEDRPRHFSLCTRKAELSRAQRSIADSEAEHAAREELNLLYVAMTRAKQALIVSGIDGNGRAASWYDKVRAAALDVAGTAAQTNEFVCVGVSLDEKKYKIKQILTKPPVVSGSVDPRLSQPLPTGTRREQAAGAGLGYGTQFHLLMEHLTGEPASDRASLQRMLGADDMEFHALWQDAQRLLTDEQLSRYFDVSRFVRAANEVPLVSDTGDTLRIDRLVEFADEVCVLDYKTGALDGVAPELLAQYRAQVGVYCVHMALAFPGRQVSGVIIFTGGGIVSVSGRE
jgi:ATP-dependent helicase/nuclease subunit A